MRLFISFLLCISLLFSFVSCAEFHKNDTVSPKSSPKASAPDDSAEETKNDEAPVRVAEDYYRTEKHSLFGVDSIIYKIYDASLNFAFESSTQDELSFTLIDNSILDICTTDEYDRETHTYFNIDTRQKSYAFEYVKAICGELLAICAPGAKSLYREHIIVLNMFDPDETYRQYTVDYPVGEVQFTPDGRAIKVYKENTVSAEVFPVRVGFDDYDSIITLFEWIVGYKRSYGDDVWHYARPDHYIRLSEVEEDYYDYLVKSFGKLNDGKSPENNFGYALKDLNVDGSDELILMRKDHHVAAIFTMVNGKPVLTTTDLFYDAVWIDTEGLVHFYDYFRADQYSTSWSEDICVSRLNDSAGFDFVIYLDVERDYYVGSGEFKKTYHKMEPGTYNAMMNISVEEYISLRFKYEPYWMGDYGTADQTDFCEYSGLTFIPFAERE